MLKVNNTNKDKQNIINLESLEILYKAYYRVLCNYTNKIISNPLAAEDIVQTFFIRLWEKRDELPENFVFQAYAHQAVKNAAIDHLRKKKNMDQLLEILTTSQQTEKENTEFIHKKLVREALKKVPYKSRKVFGLGCIAGLRYSEISDVMGISINTVKSQMAVAFRILRKELNELK